MELGRQMASYTIVGQPLTKKTGTTTNTMGLQTGLRNKQITPIGITFLLIWSFLCLAVIWALNTFPPTRQVVVQLNNPFPCENTDNEWKQKKIFKAYESIYICGHVKSTVTNLDGQIQIRVYTDKITSQVDAIFYDNQRITNGEAVIPINTYLFPGKYMVQISAGKKTLGIVAFEIVE